jgi:hypothetical protein
VESRTIGKVVCAFLAGVFFSLGGAVFYSRNATWLGLVQASDTILKPALRVSVKPPLTGSAPHEEERKSVSRPQAQTNVRLTSSAPPATPATGIQQTLLPPPLVIQQEAAVLQANLPRLPEPPAAPPLQDLPAKQPHVVTLAAGTNFTVRLREALNSDRNAAGDVFQASLETPVIADGFVIADRQSKVAGRVVQAKAAGRVKGLAALTLALSAINTTDGQQIPIETDAYEKWGNSSVKADTAKIAGGAALGAIIGALAGGGKGAAIGAGTGGAAGTGVALGTRGASAFIPSESIITFRLAHPVTITERFN